MTSNTLTMDAVGESPGAATDIAGTWTSTLETAVSERDLPTLAGLFQEDGTFRDLLALSWDFRNAVGSREIAELLCAPSTTPCEIGLRSDSTPEFGTDENRSDFVRAFLEFRTQQGSGHGFVELRPASGGKWAAQGCVLALNELDARPEMVGALRRSGREHRPVLGRLGWTEQVDPEFVRTQPEVVILGAGHNGLMLAARLRALGVNALIIERNGRVGDTWRNRYSSLALHTPLAADRLPYLPYPDTWTKQTPKEKFGDFLESYATLLDIPVWTGARVENARFDEADQGWSLDVVRADGETRSLEPAHLVFATGVNGEPKLPNLPGEREFRGTIMHAQNYRGHAEWAGKRVVVVGSGVSGHDIAQDLAEHGVDVTLVQRSGTMVLSSTTYHDLMFPNHISGAYSTEDADLIGATTPFGALPSRGADQFAIANERDRELLDGLKKAGFELSDGPDGQGLLGAIFGTGATGYYFNVGASELIIDGTIRVHQGGVVGFAPTGPKFDDGSTLEADLVVFATGYRGANTAVEEILGEDVAATLGNIARVGDDGEFGRCWRNSGIDRLWFMISMGIDAGRFYSRLLALQIAADQAGATPPEQSDN